MRRLAPRASLIAAVLYLLCAHPAVGGPRPPGAGDGRAAVARDAAHCYAVPRLDDAGPAGPAPPVADVERHPVVRHRSLARSFSGDGLALLAPPIRRFRGIDGGAYAARVAYYLVEADGCRRPIALRWYGGCRRGAPPSPHTCGRYSHTYQNDSPPMAHALVNASLLVPVGASRAAAYEYEILVGDRLHVGRLTVDAAPEGPGATPCRPVAPAVPLWRSLPAAWVADANPLFDGPDARRCASPSLPAEPQDMAHVSAAPQSLLVGLAGYLFARGDRGRAAEPPGAATPAPRAERPFPFRPARSLLSVTTATAEASPTSPPTPAPSTAAPATPSATSSAPATSSATPSAASDHTAAAGASPSAESSTPPASPEAGSSTPAPTANHSTSDAANDTAAGDDAAGGVSGSTAAPPATASPAPTAPVANVTEAASAARSPTAEPAASASPEGGAAESPSRPSPPGETGGNRTVEAGGTTTRPREPFTPRLEVLTPRPEVGAAPEGEAGEEDGDGGDGDDDEEGAGDGELPPPEHPPTPRRPASTLPPPSLGPLTLRPPSPPTEPPPPSPTEAPHTPMFPFLTASPGLDLLFLISLAAHALAFVIITAMVLGPCRPRSRMPSRHRVRYTRLATSHA
ncbi:envelope glycoprotein G [Macacine alphaherpesvirus 1]|uniref:Envelope glycoprotein G n=2 Tax=Simplexvirus TaxID=10294 RepID=A0A1X9WF60_9ALPH|nr:envelope glycoprotein G [Macacine alphaherpesvirus 1]ARS01700.1 envelope glycoprotein G [Macacine alphaherpesvirus 2]